jgi:acetate kinase
MRILVLNAGSSSLKTSVVEEPGDRTLRHDELQHAADVGWDEALAAALSDAGRIDAVGHRVVHGGERRSALLLDDGAIAQLDALRRLAPLHNGPALEVIEAARTTLAELPQVACFDTAFHAELPPAAHVYPLPYEWYTDWNVRRYGFHGLSVAWSVERASDLLSRHAPELSRHTAELSRPATELSLVVAHLGSGCSVTAVQDGRSVDTSMGMTPLEGVMMGTRGGSVDPGLLLELLAARLDLASLGDALQHRSGLAGVSGVSPDLRAVQRAAADGEPRAALALEMFVRRAAAGIAAAATALPRLDALAFTGGVGEHAAQVRAEICGRLTQLGVPAVLSPAPEPMDAVLSLPGSPVAVLRIHAREDLVIAREVAHILA